MKNKLDYNAFSSLMLEITPRFKLFETIFPKDKLHLLEHLAAASIHLTLFAKAVFLDKEGEKNINPAHINHFLKVCGCKDLKK